MGRGLSCIGVWLLGVLLTLCAASPALAEKRVALVLGNSKYTHIQQLKNPSRDAADIAAELKELGFDVIVKTDAKMAEFNSALADFSRRVKGADVALFYYAGHGVQPQQEGQTYLLPTDIEVQDEADVTYQAVELNKVREALNRSEGAKIMILDACRNNPFAKVVASRSVGDGGESRDRGLSRVDRVEGGMLIAYAAGPGTTAQDGKDGGNSPFAEAMLKWLKEPHLEIDDLFKHVTNDVLEATHRKQRPEKVSNLVGEVFLNLAESDSLVWGRVRESKNSADYKDFIARFPNSPHVLDAQRTLDLFAHIERENETRAACAREQDELRASQSKGVEALEQFRRRATCPSIGAQIDAARADLERAAARLCDTDRQSLARLEPADVAGLRNALERMKCEAVRREASDRLKAAEDRARREQQEAVRICESEKKTFSALKTKDVAVLKGALEGMSCEAARQEAQKKIAGLEEDARAMAAAQARVCEADARALAAVGAEDLSALRAALGGMSCAAVQSEARQRIAALEEKRKQSEAVARLCESESKSLLAIDAGNLDGLKNFEKTSGCPSVRNEARRKIAALENASKETAAIGASRLKEICSREETELKALSDSKNPGEIEAFRARSACPSLAAAIDRAKAKAQTEEARICAADEAALGRVKPNDLVGYKGVLERLSCERMRVDAKTRIAALEAEAVKTERLCASERAQILAVDAGSIEARKQYMALRDRLGCTALRADIDDATARLEARVRSAQTQLARLGCYNGPASGRFDEATKDAIVRYLTKKRENAQAPRVTDDFVGDLQIQNLAVCKDAPPVATAPTPEKEAPAIATTPAPVWKAPPVATTPAPQRKPAPVVEETAPRREKPRHARREDDETPHYRPQPVAPRHEAPEARPAARHAPPRAAAPERRRERAAPARVVEQPRRVAPVARAPSPPPAQESSSIKHFQGVGF